jgi:hypothetical protein
MREFTKSIVRYTWAMSLFGVQQAFNLVTPQGQCQDHPATNAFNSVAGAARQELGNTLASTYRAGDNLQRGLVDATFSVFTLGIFNRGDGLKGLSDYVSRVTSDLGRQTSASAFEVASDVSAQTSEVFQETVRTGRQAADVIGRTVGGVGRAMTDDPPSQGRS